MSKPAMNQTTPNSFPNVDAARARLKIVEDNAKARLSKPVIERQSERFDAANDVDDMWDNVPI